MLLPDAHLRQRGRELLGGAVGHRAEELDGRVLRAPLLLIERAQQRRQHHLHPLGRQLAHDLLGGGDGGVADGARAVGDRGEEEREDRDDVRLEEAAEELAEALERMERACTSRDAAA